MSKEKEKPNKNNEFLLDIFPFATNNKEMYIYDISGFLPSGKCPKRDFYLNMIAHSILRDKFLVLIIDRYNVLCRDDANKLAKEWLNEYKTTYRLD